MEWIAYNYKGRKQKTIQSGDHISGRVLKVKLELKNYVCIIIAVYRPCDDAKEADKDIFYRELTTLLKRMSNFRERVFSR